jgi:hypothetical protein
MAAQKKNTPKKKASNQLAATAKVVARTVPEKAAPVPVAPRIPLGVYPPPESTPTVRPPMAPLRTLQSAPLERPMTLRDTMQKETQVLPPKPKQRGMQKDMLRYIVLTVGSIIVLGVGSWYIFSDSLTSEQKKEAYVQSIVAKVSKLALTPPGETPTIGVIPDPASIQDNKEFFINASQGDYLVVYPNARLMLIYSPARNIVINMGYAETTPATAPAKDVAPKKKP